MNKEYDDNGVEKGDCYIVESLRDEDCFSMFIMGGCAFFLSFFTMAYAYL